MLRGDGLLYLWLSPVFLFSPRNTLSSLLLLATRGSLASLQATAVPPSCLSLLPLLLLLLQLLLLPQLLLVLQMLLLLLQLLLLLPLLLLLLLLPLLLLAAAAAAVGRPLLLAERVGEGDEPRRAQVAHRQRRGGRAGGSCRLQQAVLAAPARPGGGYKEGVQGQEAQHLELHLSRHGCLLEQPTQLLHCPLLLLLQAGIRALGGRVALGLLAVAVAGEGAGSGARLQEGALQLLDVLLQPTLLLQALQQGEEARAGQLACSWQRRRPG